MSKNILLSISIVMCTIFYPAIGQNLQSTIVKNEKQPIADLGNGYYKNPIIAGNYGDPSVVKVDKDYYMAFSRGDGFILWHSRDLVNWQPITKHFFKGYTKIWAVDLQYINGKYHLYMPIGFWPEKTSEHYMANFVSVSEKPEGPWCDPIRIDNQRIDDLYFTGIDPGFIQTKEGKKFLYNDHGYVMPLSADGLKAIGLPKLVYKGWEYPKDWIVEGECLESPKLFFKDGFYYMVSAMGGTSGPSTAHMAVVARSKNADGDWENSPFNPLVKTFSPDETWWQQGHATLIEGPDKSWWAIYHARLKDYGAIGRQTLLLPVEWTNDGWPIIKNGYKACDIIPKPNGENIGHGMAISDNFATQNIGMQWNVDDKFKKWITSGNGKLTIEAQGTNLQESTSISVNALNKSYEATVKIETQNGAVAGLCFGNNDGLKFDGQMVSHSLGEIWRTLNTETAVKNQGHVYIKIRNYKGDLSFYCSNDKITWHTFRNGARGAIYSIKLFAYGTGKVNFTNFDYLGLE